MTDLTRHDDIQRAEDIGEALLAEAAAKIPPANPEQLDADVKRYLELDAHRADITIEMDAIKARLRDGGTQLAPCGVKVTVTPNRRFSAELAAEVIPEALLPLCQETVISSAKAKAALPPAIYEAAMIEVGDKRVSIR